VIVVTPGPLGEPADRLLARAAARGATLCAGPERLPPGGAPVTLAVSDGPLVLDLLAFVRAIGPRPFRMLVLSRLGAHPDARADSLRRLWRLEEHVRGGGAPTLTLRTAPLVGPDSPLWRRLRSRPALPGGGRKLVNPVLEADVVETIVRALAEDTPWSGWYELAGPEAMTLAELRALAAGSSGPTAGGAWEPALDEMLEHRLAEWEPWAGRFGLRPTPLAAWAGREFA
jgi:uncharacterized protein YbjT (DUF2867 family)